MATDPEPMPPFVVEVAQRAQLILNLMEERMPLGWHSSREELAVTHAGLLFCTSLLAGIAEVDAAGEQRLFDINQKLVGIYRAWAANEARDDAALGVNVPGLGRA